MIESLISRAPRPSSRGRAPRTVGEKYLWMSVRALMAGYLLNHTDALSAKDVREQIVQSAKKSKDPGAHLILNKEQRSKYIV